MVHSCPLFRPEQYLAYLSVLVMLSVPAAAQTSGPRSGPPTVASLLVAGKSSPLAIDMDFAYPRFSPFGKRPMLDWSLTTANGKFQFRGKVESVSGFEEGPICISPMCPPQYYEAGVTRASTLFELGALPAGSHTIEIYGADNTSDQPDLSTRVTVAQAANPPGAPWMDYSDFWWNPQEPGTGLMAWHDVKTAQFFVAYFGYGVDGKSYWFTLQGGAWQRVQHGQSIGFRYSGTLYESNGSGFASLYKFYTLPAKPIGTGSIEFTDSGNGTFSFDITGIATKTMPITRFNP